MKRILVCGGRDFTDAEFLASKLDQVADYFGAFILIHGDARGADTLAKEWAEYGGLDVESYPADWSTHGRAAGPIRNQQMLASGVDYVIAFPGGRGTAHMVQIAKAAGVVVWDLRDS